MGGMKASALKTGPRVKRPRARISISFFLQSLQMKPSAETADGWVKDTTSLAKQLGLSRQAIYDARTRFPDAPKKHEDGHRENLAAWQQFCADNLIGKDTATKNLSDLKAELMREQIALARSKNRKEDAEVIDREIVESALSLLGQKLDLLLRLKLEVELGQRVIGKNAAEVNVEGGIMLDEIREVINGNIATFREQSLPEVDPSESLPRK